MDKTTWGIVSTANIGRRAMIPALKESEGAEVLAVASRELNKARSFADELNIPKAYGDYQSLLDDPEIQAVYIPLPNHLHKEWTIRAAEAGKHVLCEKPLALNPAECREMIDAAQANGVQLMESFMYRYHPRIRAAREMVHSGSLGQVHTIESAFTFRLDYLDDIRYKPEMGGGALMDVGCYCVNLSRLMAGREPEVVQARAVWASTGVDSALTAILDFGQGLLAHFDCGFNQSKRQRSIIAGLQSFIVLRDVFLPGTEKSNILEVKNGETHKEKFKGIDEYQLIAEDFMRSIHGEAPLYPIEDSIHNMRTIQALLRSARNNGQPVELL